MLLLTWILLLLSIISILLIITLIRRSIVDNYLHGEYKKRGNVPYYKTSNQILNFLFGKRNEIELDKILKQHPNQKYFGVNVFDESITIVLAQPELIQIVLSKEFTNFVNRRKTTFKDKVFSKILFFQEDDGWKRIRSIVAPTFSTKKLRRMIPQIKETTTTLINNLDQAVEKNGGIINIKRYTGAFTMDTIVKTAFGVKIDSMKDLDNPLVNSAREIFSPNLSKFQMLRMIFFLYFPLLRDLRMKFFKMSNANEVLYNYSKMIIDEKRKKFKSTKINNDDDSNKPSDFIELMLESEISDDPSTTATMNDGNDGGEKFKKYITEDEMLAQCLLFFFAGYDTTATTLTMSCYNLATNKDKQKKLFDEINKTIEQLKNDQTESDLNDCDNQTIITLDTINKFEYLDAVINETLRLYPVVTSIERRAAIDLHLETDDGKFKLDLKKDDVIRIPIYSLHYDPDQWSPDPEKFRPERFLGEEFNRHHKYSYIPFGSGPRICVGKSLGLIEAKIALLNIIQNYHLDICPETTIPPKFSNRTGLLSPFDILLKFEKRC